MREPPSLFSKLYTALADARSTLLMISHSFMHARALQFGGEGGRLAQKARKHESQNFNSALFVHTKLIYLPEKGWRSFGSDG